MSDKSLLKTIPRSFVWKKAIVMGDTGRPLSSLGTYISKGDVCVDDEYQELQPLTGYTLRVGAPKTRARQSALSWFSPRNAPVFTPKSHVLRAPLGPWQTGTWSRTPGVRQKSELQAPLHLWAQNPRAGPRWLL